MMLALGAPILVFGCLELSLRLFVHVTDMYFYFWDPSIGPRIKPNQVGTRVNQGISARFHFNSGGWNHPCDYSVRKTPGTLRVCLIGDSQVEAVQVENSQSMFAVAEREMSRPDRSVEWYAFANSGWGTSTEYAALRHYALDYQPDVVILLFLQNDPFDCSPYIVDTSQITVTYYLDENEQLVMVPPSPRWIPTNKAQIESNLAIYRYFIAQQRILDRLRNTNAATRPGIGGLPLMATAQLKSVDYIPGIQSMTLSDRQRMTWKLIDKLLTACRDDCNTRGAIFAIAFRGWMPEIDASWMGAPFKPSDSKDDPYCLGERISEMGRDIVGPMARRLGIPYLDLTGALKKMVEQTGQSHVFVDGKAYVDHHYNARAHEAAGKALADWVDTILAKRVPPPTTSAPALN